jgi:hypothetical protein
MCGCQVVSVSSGTLYLGSPCCDTIPVQEAQHAPVALERGGARRWLGWVRPLTPLKFRGGPVLALCIVVNTVSGSEVASKVTYKPGFHNLTGS